MATRFRCRQATLDDADGIAAVFSSSLRLLTFLPVLHTVEEDRRFIENIILKECEVIVAEGAGAGSLLLDAVKKSSVVALELWCFQANERARRFYEERGFRAVRFTDGRDNEEKVPDVRYRWERAVG
jgi:putative acetyltransferase